jgi:4-amino-4-deoxy-L-arabinose transferase-like glycosyltransferase
MICVLIFATLGRTSHRETNDLIGVAATAWPFLVGTLIGSAAARTWRNPTALRSGVVVWACTVVVGMGLRTAAGRGFSPAFVLVASIALAVLLLGWRGTLRLIRQARHARRPRATAR